MWLYSFFAFICLFFTTNGQCSWSDKGYSLDLSSIRGNMYSYINGTFTYYYSPCNDTIQCKLSNGTSFRVMADQYNPSKASCTSFLAKYDSTIPPSYDASTTSWIFKYANGQAASNCKVRYFTVTWQCDASQSTPKPTKAGESQSCYYYFTISSDKACVTGGGSSTSSSSSSLSGGWIFIILLLVFTVVYCVAGYIYNGYKNPQNGWGNVRENTPNANFWAAVPKWTWAGCCVTKDFFVGLIQKATNKSEQPAQTTE